MRRALTIFLLLFCLQMSAKAFDVRAVYVDHRTQVQTLPALKALAKKAADGGMNALVMEWESTFPFEENAVLRGKFAFSRAEVQEFIGYCSELGIDVIPLQNCFGHAEYILRHERYASLREDAKDYSQVCPLKKDGAREVFHSIFSEIAAAHPSKYLHIGCDETRLLGRDKRCAAFVEENGKSRLFVEYVSEMCSIVKELGKIPVIWADILLQNPEAAADLPKDIIIVDWNYGWNPGHFGNIDALLAQGFTMWGASSLRSSPDNIYLTQWDKHFSNLREYIPFCREKGFAGMIQTSWSTSGQYGYIWDHNSLIELQPIREVYPAQAFDILWQAFFEAVNYTGPLRDDFVPEYLEKHFGLNAGDAGLLAEYFSLPQNAVTGKKYSAEAISGELSEALRVRDMLGKVRPRANKKDYAQLRLMMDIRSNYLEYKTVEFGYESGSLGRSETAGKLKGLLKESSRLQKKFIRLNKNALKDPSIPLGEHSYVQQIKNLYERCR